MQKIGEGNRGEVFLTIKDGKKIIIKKALDNSKKASIQREIKILQKINKLGIKFVPKILNFGENYFEEEYIDGERFDKIFKESDIKIRIKLSKKLLQNCYELDKIGIVHGELARPYNNVLVRGNDVYIIDFERGHISEFGGKNMKNFGQWLKNQGFLTIAEAKKLGEFENIDEIKKFIYKKLDMKNKNIVKIVVSLVGLLALDQLTKYIFFDQKILANFFVFQPVLNKGIAWSISIDYFFVYIISILALFIFAYLYYKKSIGFWEFILFCAGTLGNLIDRVFLGGVRDFIDLRHWPVFNFADMYLTFAVFLLIYKEFITHKNKK